MKTLNADQQMAELVKEETTLKGERENYEPGSLVYDDLTNKLCEVFDHQISLQSKLSHPISFYYQ